MDDRMTENIEELNQLETNLKKVELKPIKLKWRLILLAIVLAIIVGSYFGL
jgi:hypothetical protein